MDDGLKFALWFAGLMIGIPALMFAVIFIVAKVG